MHLWDVSKYFKIIRCSRICLERVRYDDRRLKIILDSLDTGVLTVDRGGHITFFNKQAETISGFNRGDVLGKSWDVIFGPKPNPDTELFSRTIADGQGPSERQRRNKHPARIRPFRCGPITWR